MTTVTPSTKPAQVRLTRRRLGRVHRFARATRRPGRNQCADGTRLSRARGRRSSTRILRRPNQAVGDRSTRSPAGRVPGRRAARRSPPRRSKTCDGVNFLPGSPV